MKTLLIGALFIYGWLLTMTMTCATLAYLAFSGG
jgi:hypothetical protein